jgi:hypothetical protein
MTQLRPCRPRPARSAGRARLAPPPVADRVHACRRGRGLRRRLDVASSPCLRPLRAGPGRRQPHRFPVARLPLIGAPELPRFAATEWPGRGWRLTITEAGLAQCGAIVVLVNGKSKAAALRAVREGDLARPRIPGRSCAPGRPRSPGWRTRRSGRAA